MSNVRGLSMKAEEFVRQVKQDIKWLTTFLTKQPLVITVDELTYSIKVRQFVNLTEVIIFFIEGTIEINGNSFNVITLNSSQTLEKPHVLCFSQEPYLFGSCVFSVPINEIRSSP